MLPVRHCSPPPAPVPPRLRSPVTCLEPTPTQLEQLYEAIVDEFYQMHDAPSQVGADSFSYHIHFVRRSYAQQFSPGRDLVLAHGFVCR